MLGVTMDTRTYEARIEYWIERKVQAEKAIEVANNQIYQAQCAIGVIAVQEMIDTGTLKDWRE